MLLPSPPTMLLAVGGVLLAIGPWVRRGYWCEPTFFLGWFAAVYLLVMNGYTPMVPSQRMAMRSVWTADEQAIAGQALALIFGVLFAAGSYRTRLPRATESASRFGFLAFLVAGLMLVASANDGLSLALSLEIVQFAAYALRRIDDSPMPVSNAVNEIESPPKDFHVWIGMVSSLCVWLGIAIGSCLTASTQFDEIRMILEQAYRPGPGRVAIGAGSKLGLLAFGLIVAGMGGRMGLVPWQASVLECTRRCGYWTAGCVIVSGQLAAVLALARLCGTVWIGFGNELILLLLVVAGLTFLVSSALAARGLSVGDGSLRRWLSAFVLLQGGWLSIGLIASIADLNTPENSLAVASGQPGALAILLFAIGANLIGLAGLFHLMEHLSRGERPVEYVDELLGLGQLAPMSAISLMILVASLIGHPLTWGFWEKWLLMLAGFNVRAAGVSDVTPHQGVMLLVIVGGISTFFLAAVAVRFSRVMFLEMPVSRTLPQGGRASLIVGVTAAVALVVLGVYPTKLLISLSEIRETRPVLPQGEPAGKKTGGEVQAERTIKAESGQLAHP